MSSGDFAIGLGTIITGLAITVMLANLHALLVNRRKVRWDWIVLLTAALVFMLIVGSWGVSFRTLGNRAVNPPLWLFLFMLLDIIPMYLAARAVFPDYLADEGVNLADHYASVSRYIWVSIGISYVLFALWNAAHMGGEETVRTQALLIAQIVAIVPLILSRSRRVHGFMVPIVVLLFCVHHLNERLFA